jgi:hypothetical protein
MLQRRLLSHSALAQNGSPICKLLSAASRLSDERVTPRRRTPFGTGISAVKMSRLNRSSSPQPAIGLVKDRLRVISRKSAYLTLRVTVRPTMPAFLQWRQSLSSSSVSAENKSSIQCSVNFSPPSLASRAITLASPNVSRLPPAKKSTTKWRRRDFHDGHSRNRA